MDINKFVGIPWKLNGDTFENSDCVGLCRLFYKEHGWSNDFRDSEPKEVSEFRSVHVWRRLLTYCAKTMNRVDYDNLEYGDFVIFKIAGDIHTGVYLGYGNLLCMQIPTVDGSTSTIYHREWWKPYFKYAFRKK